MPHDHPWGIHEDMCIRTMSGTASAPMTGTGTGTVVGTVVGTSHDACVATSGGAHTLVTGWMCLVSEAVDAWSARQSMLCPRGQQAPPLTAVYSRARAM